MGKIQVVVGAQFGSEAKGHVVQRLTERAVSDNSAVQVIRVAGPNAGHTGYDAGGKAWALRQVPVAAVVNGPVILGIAAGSEIDLPVLLDELDRLREAGLLMGKTVWISDEATMITDRHKEIETAGNGQIVQPDDNLVERIGSTGKGIGAARADRLMRTATRLRDAWGAVAALRERGVQVTRGATPLAMPYTIIEGTQGFGLGLRAGFYPQCTSSDCRAIDFLAMAGINPFGHDVEVWAVARMYPIRVAGNSGPLKDETTWDALGLPIERTTVTQKVRRVGMPDWGLVADAIHANGGAPTVRLAVTMVDQMFPAARDLTAQDMSWHKEAFGPIWSYLYQIESETGASVDLITTGPNCASFL